MIIIGLNFTLLPVSWAATEAFIALSRAAAATRWTDQAG
jgi:hypothetical protein